MGQATGKSLKGYIKVKFGGVLGGVEWMWMAPTRKKGVYKVDNIPMFAEGVSLGDHIQVTRERDDDFEYYLAGDIVKHSGNMTVGVLMNRGGETEKALIPFLTKYGCGSEGLASESPLAYISVNVPDTLKGRRAYAALRILANSNRIKLHWLSHKEVKREIPAGLAAEFLSAAFPVEEVVQAAA